MVLIIVILMSLWEFVVAIINLVLGLEIRLAFAIFLFLENDARAPRVLAIFYYNILLTLFKVSD